MGSVAIVGAGISGLLAGYYITKESACSSLKVYEARSYVGRPHCTGLVSIETANRIPFGKDYVQRKYSLVKILVPEIKVDFNIKFKDHSFVKIDRVGLENRLYHELLALGVYFSRNDPVQDVALRDRKWFVHSRLGGGYYDHLILTSGYNTKLARETGLSFRAELLSGTQAEFEIENRLPIDEDSVLVVLSKYFGGGFSWVVPTSERELTVGCATAPSVLESTRCLRLVSSLLSKRVGGVKAISKPYGGVVLRGYPVRAFNKKAMGIGDSVAMVKSLSGGGLYGVSIATRFSFAFVKEQYDLLNHVKLLSSELKRHYYLAKAVDAAVRLAEALGVKNMCVDIYAHQVSYDDHLKLFLNIIMNENFMRLLTKRKKVALRV